MFLYFRINLFAIILLCRFDEINLESLIRQTKRNRFFWSCLSGLGKETMTEAREVPNYSTATEEALNIPKYTLFDSTLLCQSAFKNFSDPFLCEFGTQKIIPRFLLVVIT